MYSMFIKHGLLYIHHSFEPEFYYNDELDLSLRFNRWELLAIIII